MPNPPFQIHAMSLEHWPTVRKIYLEGIASGNATFETTAPDWEHWNANHHEFARLVAVKNEEVIGWAALSRVSARHVYQGVAEVSVYVAVDSHGIGLGRALLEELIKDSESHGIWTLQASIFPQNTASVALHLKCGFREVGRRERIAQLKGVWRDTILFERRSARI